MRVPAGIPVLDPDAIARRLRPERRDRDNACGNGGLASDGRGAAAGFWCSSAVHRIEDVQIAIDRIAVRVARGGHDIPTVDVRRRYVRSHGHLRAAMDLSDQVVLIDNTTEQGPRGIIGRSWPDDPTRDQPAALGDGRPRDRSRGRVISDGPVHSLGLPHSRRCTCTAEHRIAEGHGTQVCPPAMAVSKPTSPADTLRARMARKGVAVAPRRAIGTYCRGG